MKRTIATVAVLVGIMALSAGTFIAFTHRQRREAEAANAVFLDLHRALVTREFEKIHASASSSFRAQVRLEDLVARFRAFEEVHGKPTGFLVDRSGGLSLGKDGLQVGHGCAFFVIFERDGSTGVSVELDLAREGDRFKLARLAIRTAKDPLELPPGATP